MDLLQTVIIVLRFLTAGILNRLHAHTHACIHACILGRSRFLISFGDEDLELSATEFEHARWVLICEIEHEGIGVRKRTYEVEVADNGPWLWPWR